MYRRLNVDRVLETAEQLERRIAQRFPESGLVRVARELIEIVRDGRDRLSRLGEPLWPVRIASWTAILSMIAILFVLTMLAIIGSRELGSRADLLSAIQSSLDEIVLVGIAVIFLIGLESRVKRGGALRALHQYRSLAHVIDMHQLTKDPERYVYPSSTRTEASPNAPRDPFLLGRYLDYCSELLSLTSKMAALHVQDFRDPVVLNAARDVESLVGDLQAKIWQKKIILDTRPSRWGTMATPAEMPAIHEVASLVTPEKSRSRKDSSLLIEAEERSLESHPSSKPNP